ncbi:prostaglandin reductase 1-like [Uranotaenia lowii]|uniref:prostaglandin reductase 1-like n=1 Tax=Uranotaenia lowii TaxID=190385 RepID=UPI00247A6039|nr:prostaglandin reductase 1-like [Uranotaenia lowii]
MDDDGEGGKDPPSECNVEEILSEEIVPGTVDQHITHNPKNDHNAQPTSTPQENLPLEKDNELPKPPPRRRVYQPESTGPWRQSSLYFVLGLRSIRIKKLNYLIMVVKARKWLYAKKFEGEPTSANFKLVEEVLPELQDGEFLAQAEFLSVDPYMRPYMRSYEEGTLMIGGQVAKVIDSRNEKYPRGSIVFGQFGWRTHTICNPDKYNGGSNLYLLPEFGSLPLSLGLGILGMPGNTAYFGFLELCTPKEGETVVVSGAAGAVGSVVGQIAKIKGCRVIGIAGSDDKCSWLKDLGFDYTINYKTANVAEELKKGAPKGVDCYFDNVGGTITEAVMRQMNLYGRISVCGTISNYSSVPIKVQDPQTDFVFKQLKMEGFIVTKWSARWVEGLTGLMQWIKEGKLKYQETVTNGFENMPQAFMDMLKGANTGKAVVKV